MLARTEHRTRLRRHGEGILRGCAGVSRRHPWLVLALAAVLTVLAGYASTFLRMNTGTDDILAADLAFRRNERNYARTFPDRSYQLIAVVDATSPEAADAAASRLVEALRRRPNAFQHVELPGDSPYFRRYGLLFLPPDELESLAGRLSSAQPALATLAKDPSLRGIVSLFDMIQAGANMGAVSGGLVSFVDRVADTVEARAQGGEATLDWAGALGLERQRGGTRRLVLIDPVFDDTSLERAEPALSVLRQEIAALERSDIGKDVNVRITGEPALRQQELNDAFSGALYAAVLSFILVALSLFLGIRSGRMIVALLVTLVIGSVWTTGLAAVTVGQINLISIAFLVLFFGLGIDFGTHLALRYLEEARKGAAPSTAITRATVGEGPAITLSAVCASIGFLAFGPTDYVGLAELGIISALGMTVALAITFSVLPALIRIWPPRSASRGVRNIRIGGWIKSHARGILVIAGLATAGAAVLASQARLDVNPLNLQNPETEPVRTYRDLAHDPETSPYAINVLTPTLDAASALAERLSQLEGVAGIRTAASFIPEGQEEKLPVLARMGRALAPALDTPEVQPAPDDAALKQAFSGLRDVASSLSATAGSEALAQASAQLDAALERYAANRGSEPTALRGLDEALTAQLPVLMNRLREGLSVSEPISVEDLPAKLRRDWIAPDGQVRLQVLPAAEVGDTRSLEAFAERVQAVAPLATGVPVAVTEAGNVVLRAFAKAILYATAAIALLVALLRRRVTDVVLILAPLAVASLWTVAASAALDLPFNFANVIVIPLLLGLGVASSVHIVVRARELEEHSAGGRPAGGVLETSTPLAVLIAQLNTVAAFATLAVSDHYGLYSMGALLGLAILFVLVAALVVLPAFMVVLERRKARPAQST